MNELSPLSRSSRTRRYLRQTLSAESEPRSLLVDTLAARERDQRMMRHERLWLDSAGRSVLRAEELLWPFAG